MTADAPGRAPTSRGRSRSRSRAWVLQLLYGWEMSGRGSFSDYADETLLRRRMSDRYRRHARRLIEVLDSELPDIDARIERSMPNWRMERLAAIDRNILRIGAAELSRFEDVPPTVAIHEAMQLAERYGSDESARFVNGVLDAVRRSDG